jgi:hypothetical protein
MAYIMIAVALIVVEVFHLTATSKPELARLPVKITVYRRRKI